MLAALLILEIGLRVADFGSDQLLSPDAKLGWRLIPNKTGLSQADCYKATVSTNSQGWRSAEVPVAKPDRVARVAVLGDSVMAGLQVEDDQTFSSELANELSRRQPDRRIEVLNFGVPGFGTDQEYLAFREYARAFSPDVVVLAFYAQNDLVNNYDRLDRRGTVYPKPFFDLENGQLVERPFIDSTPLLVSLGRSAVADSRIYPWLRTTAMQSPTVHRWLYRTGIVGIVPAEAANQPNPAATAWRWPARWRKQLGAYEREYPDEFNHSWQITQALLLRVRDAAEAAGAGFVLVGLPDPVAVMPISMRKALTSEAEGATAKAYDFDRPTRILESFAEDHEIAFVSLVEGFRTRIGESETKLAQYYLACDGHWTPAGHRLAARLVAPYVIVDLESPSAHPTRQPARPGPTPPDTRKLQRDGATASR